MSKLVTNAEIVAISVIISTSIIWEFLPVAIVILGVVVLLISSNK